MDQLDILEDILEDILGDIPDFPEDILDMGLARELDLFILVLYIAVAA